MTTPMFVSMNPPINDQNAKSSSHNQNGLIVIVSNLHPLEGFQPPNASNHRMDPLMVC
jgi:hypothetical protein